MDNVPDLCKHIKSFSWANFVYKEEKSKMEIDVSLFLLINLFAVTVSGMLFYNFQYSQKKLKW